jgi:EAL and modified HD-GYP domain-containing signal transduction protein
MDTFIARQPILDRDQKVYAYELLFRDSLDNSMPRIDGDAATGQLLKNSLLNIGLNEICNGRYAFINFTDNLLRQQLPLLLPREQVVVEILEDVAITNELITACQEIAKQGFTIALDDFVYREEYHPLLEIADIIKFDFRASSVDEIRIQIESIKKFKLRLLAEKVETKEDFETAIKLGFVLFQGYFFCRPEIIKGKDIPTSQFAQLELAATVSQAELDYDKLNEIINRDIGLSYKLLRYINSPFYAKLHKISAIKQALAYMGGDEIRRFIALSTISELSRNQPAELLRISCIRAKFCELLGANSPATAKPGELFTVGLFSMLDTIMGQPMTKILIHLPLSDNLVTALTQRKGTLAAFLMLTIAYERGAWNLVDKLTQKLKIDSHLIPELYATACRWSNSAATIND